MFEPYYCYLVDRENVRDALLSLDGVTEEESELFAYELENGSDVSISSDLYDYGHFVSHKSVDTHYYFFEPFFCTIENEQFIPVICSYRHLVPFKKDEKGYTYDLFRLIGAINGVFGKCVDYRELKETLTKNCTGYLHTIRPRIDLQITLGFGNTDGVSATRDGLLRVKHNGDPQLAIYLGLLQDNSDPYYLEYKEQKLLNSM